MRVRCGRVSGILLFSLVLFASSTTLPGNVIRALEQGSAKGMTDAVPPRFELDPLVAAAPGWEIVAGVQSGGVRQAERFHCDGFARSRVDPSGAESEIAEGGNRGGHDPTCLCARLGREHPARLGRAWQRLSVDGSVSDPALAVGNARRARAVRRSQGECLGDRKRPCGAQVLARREVPPADRRALEEQRKQRPQAAWAIRPNWLSTPPRTRSTSPTVTTIVA